MDYNRYKAQLERARLAKNSCMNNTKWFELFHLIYANKAQVQKMLIKFLGGDQILAYPAMGVNGFDELGVRDGNHPGPFKFYEIEYLEIPKQIVVERKNREQALAPNTIFQDIELLNGLFKRIGQLSIEYTEGEKIRVYGYN